MMTWSNLKKILAIGLISVALLSFSGAAQAWWHPHIHIHIHIPSPSSIVHHIVSAAHTVEHHVVSAAHTVAHHAIAAAHDVGSALEHGAEAGLHGVEGLAHGVVAAGLGFAGKVAGTFGSNPLSRALNNAASNQYHDAQENMSTATAQAHEASHAIKALENVTGITALDHLIMKNVVDPVGHFLSAGAKLMAKPFTAMVSAWKKCAADPSTATCSKAIVDTAVAAVDVVTLPMTIAPQVLAATAVDIAASAGASPQIIGIVTAVGSGLNSYGGIISTVGTVVTSASDIIIGGTLSIIGKLTGNKSLENKGIHDVSVGEATVLAKAAGLAQVVRNIGVDVANGAIEYINVVRGHSLHDHDFGQLHHLGGKVLANLATEGTPAWYLLQMSHKTGQTANTFVKNNLKHFIVALHELVPTTGANKGKSLTATQIAQYLMAFGITQAMINNNSSAAANAKKWKISILKTKITAEVNKFKANPKELADIKNNPLLLYYALEQHAATETLPFLNGVFVKLVGRTFTSVQTEARTPIPKKTNVTQFIASLKTNHAWKYYKKHPVRFLSYMRNLPTAMQKGVFLKMGLNFANAEKQYHKDKLAFAQYEHDQSIQNNAFSAITAERASYQNTRYGTAFQKAAKYIKESHTSSAKNGFDFNTNLNKTLSDLLSQYNPSDSAYLAMKVGVSSRALKATGQVSAEVINQMAAYRRSVLEPGLGMSQMGIDIQNNLKEEIQFLVNNTKITPQQRYQALLKLNVLPSQFKSYIKIGLIKPADSKNVQLIQKNWAAYTTWLLDKKIPTTGKPAYTSRDIGRYLENNNIPVALVQADVLAGKIRFSPNYVAGPSVLNGWQTHLTPQMVTSVLAASMMEADSASPMARAALSHAIKTKYGPLLEQNLSGAIAMMRTALGETEQSGGNLHIAQVLQSAGVNEDALLQSSVGDALQGFNANMQVAAANFVQPVTSVTMYTDFVKKSVHLTVEQYLPSHTVAVIGYLKAHGFDAEQSARFLAMAGANPTTMLKGNLLTPHVVSVGINQYVALNNLANIQRLSRPTLTKPYTLTAAETALQKVLTVSGESQKANANFSPSNVFNTYRVGNGVNKASINKNVPQMIGYLHNELWYNPMKIASTLYKMGVSNSNISRSILKPVVTAFNQTMNNVLATYTKPVSNTKAFLSLHADMTKKFKHFLSEHTSSALDYLKASGFGPEYAARLFILSGVSTGHLVQAGMSRLNIAPVKARVDRVINDEALYEPSYIPPVRSIPSALASSVVTQKAVENYKRAVKQHQNNQEKLATTEKSFSGQFSQDANRQVNSAPSQSTSEELYSQ